MNGKYEIQIYNNKVHYHLTIKRNITIFQGDSASGKSEMIRLLTAYNNRHESSGVTLISEKICTVLTEEDWEMRLSGYHDRIIFIDEGNSFVRSKRFAGYVKQSDNYFIIIYRDSLHELPYSIFAHCETSFSYLPFYHANLSLTLHQSCINLAIWRRKIFTNYYSRRKGAGAD